MSDRVSTANIPVPAARLMPTLYIPGRCRNLAAIVAGLLALLSAVGTFGADALTVEAEEDFSNAIPARGIVRDFAEYPRSAALEAIEAAPATRLSELSSPEGLARFRQRWSRGMVAPAEVLQFDELPAEEVEGSRFHYLNGIYIDAQSCQGLTPSLLALIGNDISQHMGCMTDAAAQSLAGGRDAEARVLLTHLQRLVAVLDLRDTRDGMRLFGTRQKDSASACELLTGVPCTTYDRPPGPVLTCYRVPSGQNAGKPLYATSDPGESIAYFDPGLGRHRAFNHPHLNLGRVRDVFGGQTTYGDLVADLNVPVFHELLHSAGYRHAPGAENEYAYPCGSLCNRDGSLHRAFVELCGRPPGAYADPAYAEAVRRYFAPARTYRAAPPGITPRRVTPLAN